MRNTGRTPPRPELQHLHERVRLPLRDHIHGDANHFCFRFRDTTAGKAATQKIATPPRKQAVSNESPSTHPASDHVISIVNAQYRTTSALSNMAGMRTGALIFVSSLSIITGVSFGLDPLPLKPGVDRKFRGGGKMSEDFAFPNPCGPSTGLGTSQDPGQLQIYRRAAWPVNGTGRWAALCGKSHQGPIWVTEMTAKQQELRYVLEFLGILAAIILYDGYGVRYHDVSHRSPYADQIGQRCTVLKGLVAHGYTLDLRRMDLTHEVDVTTLPGIGGPEITFRVPLPKGTTIVINGARNCWSCLFPRVQYAVTIPDVAKLSPYRVFAREEVLAPDEVHCGR